MANGNILIGFVVYNIKEHPVPKDRKVLVRVASYDGMCWTEVEWIDGYSSFYFPVDTENMVDIDTATHWCELPVIKEKI